MIPYFTVSDKSIGPVQWFGILVVAAVMLGMSITRWRARRLGCDAEKLESFIWWMLVGGFVGGHVIGDLIYFPKQVMRDPVSLLYLWKGQSSFPGFLGALLGVLLWKWIRGRGQPIMPFADVILSVFPISWVLGRLGCTLVHDHPGTRATGPFAFLAVDYPSGNIHGIAAGPHWNLGLLEMLYAIVISIVVVAMWRGRRPVGTFAATTLLLYAPVRFLLDFLRTGDELYLGFTPGQYFSAAIFGLGAYLLVRSRAGAYDSTKTTVNFVERQQN